LDKQQGQPPHLYALPGARLGIVHDENKAGVYIVNVLVDSPARRAGIQIGDRITKVNGTPIRSSEEFDKLVMPQLEKDRVDLAFVVERKGTMKEMKVSLSPR
jgi:S1-C subfamily serine protease